LVETNFRKKRKLVGRTAVSLENNKWNTARRNFRERVFSPKFDGNVKKGIRSLEPYWSLTQGRDKSHLFKYPLTAAYICMHVDLSLAPLILFFSFVCPCLPQRGGEGGIGEGEGLVVPTGC
jgi:hypothetical protein